MRRKHTQHYPHVDRPVLEDLRRIRSLEIGPRPRGRLAGGRGACGAEDGLAAVPCHSGTTSTTFEFTAEIVLAIVVAGCRTAHVCSFVRKQSTTSSNKRGKACEKTLPSCFHTILRHQQKVGAAVASMCFREKTPSS